MSARGEGAVFYSTQFEPLLRRNMTLRNVTKLTQGFVAFTL